MDLNVPILGNRWIVGLAFQVHIVMVAFIMGIAILAPVAEWLGLRPGRERWEWLAHGLSTTIVRLFAFGATWAVLGLVLIYGLYPRLFGVLTSIFFWPLVVVGGLWFVMTFSSYAYYLSWNALSDRRGLHITIGITFAITTFVFISIISMLSSYQLTPTDPGSLAAAATNPSWLTEITHRHVGNLSYAALLLASYAGIRVALPMRGHAIDRTTYDWLGDTMLLLGVGLALVQPVVGWLYARQVQLASPGAYDRMMVGENSWMWIVQGVFFVGILLLTDLYLVAGMQRGRPSPVLTDRMRYMVLAVGILGLLLLVPKDWPLGQMMPWKYVSLVGLVLGTAGLLSLYLRERPSFEWGNGGRFTRLALAGVGIAIVALMVTMGVIRESARGDDLIYGRMGPTDAQQIRSP